MQNNETFIDGIEFIPGVGFLHAKFTDKQLQPIRNEVDEMLKNNFRMSKRRNQDLAGNIEHEYEIKCKNYVSDLVLPLTQEFESRWKYISGMGYLTENRPIVLDGVWANFQKKHEFNPPHIHLGILSFVIWLNIPYDIEDEKSVNQSRDSALNIPGHFQFLYTSSLGKISQCNIPVDKKFNGTIALFPSEMVHAVYPFTTSDDYRITIAGNFKYKV